MNTLISNKPKVYDARFNQKIATAILAVAIGFFFSGCAAFSDQIVSQQKVKLTKKSLNHLSGTYQLFPDLAYTQNTSGKVLRYKGKAEELHQYIGKSKILFDPSAKNSMIVRVLDNNQVYFVFKKDSLIVDTITLSARLQRRGLLLLKNRYVKYTGVPYIFGGSESSKMRIGLTNDDGLILNYAYERSGALLIIIVGARSSNQAYHFKRINNNYN